ncbi:glycosyltransferase family 2 protein [Dyadobacter sp. CY343]|uniref:glycosyltransferase family 2 protein n=1 Tax=Dyadobacter sp. CY343 TaxID=2907299 RepID=UPI001F402225|nr:glycosyltransferase family 2 protein [Dyadobacter sp. CY343]MCE7058637.1 glycosyltransferase [Dyadobacter sp. CY343]
MLSVLIPTYNRSEFLMKNLEMLAEMVGQGGFTDKVRLVVSDNCSPDDTFEKVSEFKELGKINIDFYRQRENIGLKANVLFVLEKATSEYVMFLGDDDYISLEYLSSCLNIIEADPKTAYIVPNYVPVSIDNELVSESRDPIGPVKKFLPGNATMFRCAWKAHQMSGLIFKRAGLFEAYHQAKVDNLYPYIFFAGISCMKGTTYLVTEFPVRVVQPVKKKDWGYGKDGLINDFFDNYKKLPISSGLRFKLESSLINMQFWRLTMYKSLGATAYRNAFFNIAFAKNASTLFSLFFPFLILIIKIKQKFEA